MMRIALHQIFAPLLQKIKAWSRFFRANDQEYAQRLEGEKEHFDECLVVHELPEIFHYWSNKYLVPMFEPFGFNSPNDFFLKFIKDKCEQSPQELISIASIGAGNCDLEIEMGRQLSAAGILNFKIDCLEINQNMLERAKASVDADELNSRFRFLQEDFNLWRPSRRMYDVILANQSLHHVLELEHLFDSVLIGLAKDGLFLTSDMIGRNGHQRWPEALRIVDKFWEELPEAYRYNQLLRRQEDSYINHDCSTGSFEGVRAQDILPLLIKRFKFQLFIPFGNVTYVFIDRPFGHNFNAAGEWDRTFIDRLHEADEQFILDDTIKPTSMLAAMTVESCKTKLRHERLTPRFCVREP